MEIKIGETVATGRVSGLWNKESKSFEVKRGMTKNEKKYQIFEVSVSRKNEDGTWTNGKGLKVMLWGETPVEHGQEIGLKGRLQPDNWENKEGKTIYGNMLVVFEDGIFTPAKWEKKSEDTPKEDKKDDEELPW
jgi:single-stranded DNA-binding protein